MPVSRKTLNDIASELERIGKLEAENKRLRHENERLRNSVNRAYSVSDLMFAIAYMPVSSDDTGAEYDSAICAGRELGLVPARIVDSCLGLVPTCGGSAWHFVNQDLRYLDKQREGD